MELNGDAKELMQIIENATSCQERLTPLKVRILN